MAVVGPGAVVDTGVEQKATLDGASEYEYVTLLNPLTDDFAVMVAQDIPVNMPVEIRDKTGMIQDSRDVVTNYGLDLKNPEFKSRKHISNTTIIPAGQTLRFKGNDAQVAVRQLTNEILQREGKARLLADPSLRKEVEDRIIISRGSIQDLMDSSLQTTRDQATDAINKSNEVTDEPAFPGLTAGTNEGTIEDQRTTETSSDLGADSPTPTKRSPGRPKKT